MYMNLVFKTVMLYFIIVIAYRIMGKKEVGELNIIDLIVTILIAELAAISIEEDSKSIFTSIVPIFSLVSIQVAISYFSLKSNKLRDFVDGKPTVVIKAGKVVFSQMSKMRYTLDDLMIQLREQGIKSIEEVDYAVLENSGQLSVFKNTKDYPIPLIMDGVVDEDILKEIKKDRKWLDKLFEKNNINLEDIFYAFYRKNKTYIIKRSDLL